MSSQSGLIAAHGFNRWLRRQRKRDDPVGDLARDSAKDPRWPRHANLKRSFVRYLSSRGVAEKVLASFESAWQEFQEASNEPTS